MQNEEKNIDIISTQSSTVDNNVLNSPNADHTLTTICTGDKSLDTETKGPQIRSSSRVIKKPKQDGASAVVSIRYKYHNECTIQIFYCYIHSSIFFYLDS